MYLSHLIVGVGAELCRSGGGLHWHWRLHRANCGAASSQRRPRSQLCEVSRGSQTKPDIRHYSIWYTVSLLPDNKKIGRGLVISRIQWTNKKSSMF